MDYGFKRKIKRQIELKQVCLSSWRENFQSTDQISENGEDCNALNLYIKKQG